MPSFENLNNLIFFSRKELKGTILKKPILNSLMFITVNTSV